MKKDATKAATGRNTSSGQDLTEATDNFDERWHGIVMPGLLRRRFRDQFDGILSDIFEPNVDIESPLSMGVVLKAYDEADQRVGLHWPIISKRLWQYGFDPLITSYVETSETLLDAMYGITSTPTTIYPALNMKAHVDPAGVLSSWRPTFPLGPRHWAILQTHLILAQTAFFKRHAADEARGVIFKTSIPQNEFSEVLQGIATCEFEFGVEPDAVSIFYPMELLRTRLPFPNKSLNKILHNELTRRTLLASEDDQVINEVKRTIRANLPELIGADLAAAAVNQSQRTLQRILNRNDLSFTDLRTDERKEFILLKLSQPELSDAIHEELGFPTREALSRFCSKHFKLSLTRLIGRTDT